MNGDWGLCKDCKWWQIEPQAKAQNLTAGQCIEEQLRTFQLRVSGDSGCNRFSEGESARAEGASTEPPSAQPQR